jgi:hypothetical protein
VSTTASPTVQPTERPELSIVVTVVEGGLALERFLTALCSQHDAPSMEVLVPLDESVASLFALQSQFPSVQFLALGEVPTARPITSAGGQHELYDRRRTAALNVTTGAIVAILEDRGVPRPDWAATVVRLHAQPWAVIGGAIEPAPSGLLDWALYVCDFSRYALPLAPGPADWVSDVNVSYKRQALESTRHLWLDRFHEPTVHWELHRQGEALFLTPDLIVDHYRTPKPLHASLLERFHWGRLYGYIRAREISAGKRVLLALAAPLVPFVLLLRHAKVHVRRGHGWRYLAATPALFALLASWAFGEAIGTLTGRP